MKKKPHSVAAFIFTNSKICVIIIQTVTMEIIICRTMFCPKCYANDRPKKGDKFVVYGSTRKDFHAKRCKSESVRGYTPHIISFSQPLIYKDSKIELRVACGICEASYYYKEQQLFFTFSGARYMHVSLSDFQALLMKWIQTGYEII